MTARAPVDLLLDSLPRLVLVAGKGGVGKTTTAAALALASARRGLRTLLVSTDPAGTLAAAIDTPLGAEPHAVDGAPGLDAFQMDASVLRSAFLERRRDVIITIIDRGTYLDRDDIDGLVDAAFPGADEAFAVLRLAELARANEYQRIVVDTAPTGHTLRLLSLPQTFQALIALLEAMQGKHRFMVRALTHRYHADGADAFLDELRAEIASLRETLGDPARTAAVVVERDEPVVRAESERLVSALGDLGIAVAARVVNAFPFGAGNVTVPDERFVVPVLNPFPMGREGLERWSNALRPAKSLRRRPPTDVRRRTAPGSSGSETEVDLAALLRPLTIVGGKGGVGKTTVACALAIESAVASHSTLLVSTDPAPSIADALALPVPDEDTPIDGAPGLVARQMDAAAAFERLRREYQERIDALFDAFVTRGIDAAHDRAILRDLLALSPPGMDELYAMASLGETLADGRFDRVIVDPAPTGHLLRLLEMPAIALDWSRRLMRLMLKYREVAGLGDAAQALLDFSGQTRALQTLLGQPERSGILVVALDEPLVRIESARLVETVRGHRMNVVAIVWNRAPNPRPLPLPLFLPADQYFAPARRPGPVGVKALRDWAAQWRAPSPGLDRR